MDIKKSPEIEAEVFNSASIIESKYALNNEK